jgi:DNA polymerase I
LSGGRFIADTETDGFLEDLTKIHCIWLRNLDTGEKLDFADQPGYRPIAEGLKILSEADEIAGHNWIVFDDPAIRKVYPQWTTKANTVDTLVWAKLVCPKDELNGGDFKRHRKGNFPAKMIGRYSLAAFGHRMGEYKGDFDGPWDTWTPAMHEYCGQDVEVNAQLYAKLKAKGRPQPAFDIEHQTQWIVARQERHGFLFDEAKAQELETVLVTRKLELEKELRSEFTALFMREGGAKGSTIKPKGKYAVRKGWVVDGVDEVFKTKKEASEHGEPTKGSLEVWVDPLPTKYIMEDGTELKVSREDGAPYTKIKLYEFNPGSRPHIEHWLRVKRSWVPSEVGDGGKAKLDDEVLTKLPWPETLLLGEYLMIKKRIGQLSTGDKAWLRYVKSDGRIHGRHNTNGAGTGRMTHNDPNMGQVPGITDRKTGEPQAYGKECRELFTAPPNKKLVGIDADALELRCLAGRMKKYDGGAYIKTVLEGNKADGTDMHSVNMRALLFDARDPAKTWFYAFIYGSGNENLGHIAGVFGPLKKDGRGNLVDFKARNRGAKDRKNFLENLPALGKLIEKVGEAADERGFITALDGRRIPIRSKHAALNTLLQSDGAIIMKKALCIFDDDLQSLGLMPGEDYEFVANVHDEWQMEVNPEHAETVGKVGTEAIRKAGEELSFPCPLAANYEIGDTWADTH